MSATIRVEIDKAGNPTISVNGVKGLSCEQLTADLERALGKTVTHKPTGEAYEIPVETGSGRKEEA